MPRSLLSLRCAVAYLGVLGGCAVARHNSLAERGSFLVQSTADPSSRLYLLHRSGDRPLGPPVIIVHGLSYPSALFDVPVNGKSFIEQLASLGFEVYALDLRGYGSSTRPAFMREAPSRSQPSLARMSDAVQDIDDAVAFVRKRHGVDKVDLIGYSWGSARSANFIAFQPGKVRRLVLIAPVNRPMQTAVVKTAADPGDPEKLSPSLGGYRIAGEDDLRSEWNRQIGTGNPAAFRDEAVVTAATRALLNSDRELGNNQFRAPLGPMLDALDVRRGRLLFDPARVTISTLIIRGLQDSLSSQEDAWSIFESLGTAEKRFLAIAQATHFLFLERRIDQLVAEIHLFLRE